MQYEGEASAPGDPFSHSALIYGSDDVFLDVALPFVEEGIAGHEPTLVAVSAQNVENLRAVLGGEPEGTALHSVEEWYETSARTREKFARWAGDTPGQGRVRVIQEPPWAVGNEAQIRDWARYESVLNVAFEGVPASFVCTYDARELPQEILEHALCTHPEIASAAGPVHSGAYEDPYDFCRRLDSDVERPEGEPSTVLDFDLADLRKIRRLVASEAVASGLPGSRADELAFAVNELASNAVVHGRLPAALRIWQGDGELICEVSDAGDGIDDALAGQLAPPAEKIGGRGLWLTRMLCDAVEIRNRVGCTVAIHAIAPQFALVG
jgi:anti-sigma regulatory factor (Ser/Thr protein kinase)